MNVLIRLRRNTLVWLTHRAALPLLVLIRRPAPFPYRTADLPHMPEGSIGRALLHFLQSNNLHMLNHYERHDIKHVLLGYPPEEEGEVCLQTFMLGNGHLSFPVMATVLFGLLTMPGSWKAMRAAYHRGRSAKTVDGLDWAAILLQDLEATRRNLQIAPAIGHESRMLRAGSWL